MIISWLLTFGILSASSFSRSYSFWFFLSHGSLPVRGPRRRHSSHLDLLQALVNFASLWDIAILTTTDTCLSHMLWLRLLVLAPFSCSIALEKDDWISRAGSVPNLDDQDFPPADSPFLTPAVEQPLLPPFDNTYASQTAQQGTPGIIRLADSQSQDHTPVLHVARNARHDTIPYLLPASSSQTRPPLSHNSSDFGLTRSSKSRTTSG